MSSRRHHPPLLITLRGQSSKRGSTHQDVDIRCSEQPSSPLPQARLHSPPSTGWTWGDWRKVSEVYYLQSKDDLQSSCFLPLQKCLSFQRLYKPQSLLSTNAWYALVEECQCTVNMSYSCRWFWCCKFQIPYLRNIITAEKDGQTDKILSGEL